MMPASRNSGALKMTPPRPSLGLASSLPPITPIQARPKESCDVAARKRLTLVRLFEELRGLGYGGSYADRIAIRQDGHIVAEQRRSFGRAETIYDSWHYVPVLVRKPGALRPRERHRTASNSPCGRLA